MQNNGKYDDLVTGYLTGDLDAREQEQLRNAIHDDEFLDTLDSYGESYGAAWLDRFETGKARNWDLLSSRAGMDGTRRKNPAFRRILTAFAAAAAIAAALWCGALWQSSRDAVPSAVCYVSVPKGSHMRLTLPDSTEVWLNSGSEFSYPADFRTRSVTLTGEGLFRVTHDPGRPFTVSTPDMGVTVLGTVFNLRSYPDEPTSEVALIDGSVEVRGRASGLTKVISPDQRAVMDGETGIITVENVDAARTAQWTSGKLNFYDATLPSLLRDIERYKDVSFSYDPHLLEGETFTGSLSLDYPVDAMLRYIDMDRKLNWDRHGDTIIIYAKK